MVKNNQKNTAEDEEIKVTLICTVYNEGESIRNLLESILEQTKLPDEVIIVDGGSTDQTTEIIQEYADKYNWIKLIIEDGANIAEGRNTAVKNASNPYIVGTDGGCVLEPTWFENMKQKFEEGAHFVAGMWKPRTESMFEKVQGRIIANKTSPEEFKKGDRGPSSRSIGFSKKAWEKVGGYPEDLYTGEDSKFNAKLLSENIHMAVAENAMVQWKMRPNWKSLFKQFYRYGEGDARAGNLFTHPNQKLGITKTLLTILLGDARLLSIITIILGLTIYPFLLTPGLILLAITILIPWLYIAQPLKQTLKEDGLKAFTQGLIIGQLKIGAFYLGFTKEIIKKPSLIKKQFTEAKKHG